MDAVLDALGGDRLLPQKQAIAAALVDLVEALITEKTRDASAEDE